MRNIQCHEACSMSHPPITGPSAVVIAVNPDQVPIALPRDCSSNEALIMARLPGTRAAAPITCKTLDERAQPIEANANRPVPRRKTRRRPTESPSAPPTRISADRNKPYDSTTHCTSTRVALRLDCSAGKATFTTVPSMNAMLEPRMVAARIQGDDSARHGLLQSPVRITASSHGCFMKGLDADPTPLDSNHHSLAV